MATKKPDKKAEAGKPNTAGQVMELIYPIDPHDLRTEFADHIQIHTLPETVMLDFCRIHPQKFEGVVGDTPPRVPSTVFGRLCITKGHAERLAKQLLLMLDKDKRVMAQLRKAKDKSGA